MKGKTGTGEVVTVSFSVPKDSLEYWQKRLDEKDIPSGKVFKRFNQTVLPFRDPDGLNLELVFEKVENAPETSRKGNIPAKNAVRGFWGTTLKLTEVESTAAILENILGFEKRAEEDNYIRFTTDAPIGGSVLIEVINPEESVSGRGTVHHVAFRAADEEMLSELRRKVQQKGLAPTKIIDRYWFKSVYFRTTGGVLFEMATEGPGYAVDEDPAHLGEKLILPPWLESRREEIEKNLPKI